jgi:hypothetical protein
MQQNGPDLEDTSLEGTVEASDERSDPLRPEISRNPCPFWQLPFSEVYDAVAGPAAEVDTAVAAGVVHAGAPGPPHTYCTSGPLAPTKSNPAATAQSAWCVLIVVFIT